MVRHAETAWMKQSHVFKGGVKAAGPGRKLRDTLMAVMVKHAEYKDDIVRVLGVPERDVISWLRGVHPSSHTKPVCEKLRRLSSALDTLKMITSQWPSVFRGNMRPLKIGIDKDIKAQGEGFRSRRQITQALDVYTGRPAYLSALKSGMRRIGLDGMDAGEVSDAHRRSAEKKMVRGS